MAVCLPLVVSFGPVPGALLMCVLIHKACWHEVFHDYRGISDEKVMLCDIGALSAVGDCIAHICNKFYGRPGKLATSLVTISMGVISAARKTALCHAMEPQSESFRPNVHLCNLTLQHTISHKLPAELTTPWHKHQLWDARFIFAAVFCWWSSGCDRHVPIRPGWRGAFRYESAG